MTEATTVVDENGNEKQMIGRPAGLRDFDVKKITGKKDIDWRCPSCDEVGHFSRLYRSRPACATMKCRVKYFSVFA